MTIRHNIFSHNNNGYHSNNSTFSNKIGVIYLETGLHLVTEIHAKYLKKKKKIIIQYQCLDRGSHVQGCRELRKIA